MMDFERTKIVEKENKETKRVKKERMFIRRDLKNNINSKYDAENVSDKCLNVIKKLI